MKLIKHFALTTANKSAASIVALIGLTAASLISCQRQPNVANTVQVSSECGSQRQIALHDLKTNNLKYYAFGFAGPSKEFVDDLKKYNVTVISQGCAVTAELSCYNNVVDSIVYSLHGVRIADLNKR